MLPAMLLAAACLAAPAAAAPPAACTAAQSVRVTDQVDNMKSGGECSCPSFPAPPADGSRCPPKGQECGVAPGTTPNYYRQLTDSPEWPGINGCRNTSAPQPVPGCFSWCAAQCAPRGQRVRPVEFTRQGRPQVRALQHHQGAARRPQLRLARDRHRLLRQGRRRRRHLLHCPWPWPRPGPWPGSGSLAHPFAHPFADPPAASAEPDGELRPVRQPSRDVPERPALPQVREDLLPLPQVSELREMPKR